MSKINLTTTLKHLYGPPTTFTVVEVPPMHYLMIDGHGDPNTAESYAQAVEALYAVSYRIKFISKDDLQRDYIVPPLEGLWWADDLTNFTTNRDKSTWDWTMMILVPDWITPEIIERARDDVAKKKDLPALPLLRAETLHEGTVVQIMHIGSYDDEAPTLRRLHEEWLPQNGYRERGKHHEIYLSDPRRTVPERLKTVLRQPIEPR